MRIESSVLLTGEDEARVSARIRWEDTGREPFDLFFESRGVAAGALRADPNALLLAAALPAMRQGERRIVLEGAVCPLLRDGLRAAAAILESWYGPPRTLPAIEPSGGFRAPQPAAARRAAGFLSGGMDSLDVFLRNHDAVPAGHPARLEEALHVSGLPFTGSPGSPSSESFVTRGRTAAAAVARSFGIPLTFVRTNLGELDPDFLFFRQEYFGSAYAAIAHLFSSRFTTVSYASAQHLGTRLDPLGSHPLLDPLYSTAALEFRHAGADRARLAKAKGLAARPDLLSHLYVCLRTPLETPGANCGRCEKCLHTQIELLLAGAATSAFPVGCLSAESIRAIGADPHTAFFWRQLGTPLRRAGRPDLAAAVDEKLAEMERVRAWTRGAGWKGALRRLDHRFLGERLVRVHRAFSRRARA